MEFDFSVSAESVKQNPNKDIDIGSKLLQLSHSIDKTKNIDDTDTKFSEEHSDMKLSSIQLTETTIHSTSSKTNPSKTTSSYSTRSSNDETLHPTAINATKMWEHFIPRVKKIGPGPYFDRKIVNISSTIEPTTTNGTEVKDKLAQEYDIKDHLNDSSRFVGFHKSIESNSSMKALNQSKTQTDELKRIDNTTSPKSNHTSADDTKRAKVVKIVTLSSGIKSNAKDNTNTTSSPDLLSTSQKDYSYNDKFQFKNSTMLTTKGKEMK